MTILSTVTTDLVIPIHSMFSMIDNSLPYGQYYHTQNKLFSSIYIQTIYD